MTEQASSTPGNPLGIDPQVLEYFRRYTAQSQARHLLPYLRPGQRLLDFGCGPGAISVGLARAVEPGELHGVDLDESRIEAARTIAGIQGQDNAAFQVADVLDLPFEDGYFDVAHGHDVLMYVPDTAAVLAEVKRVLKPGGIISCREIISDSCFMHPGSSVMMRGWDIYGELLVDDGGHPQIGKELKARLAEAGFVNARITGSVDTYNTPADIDLIHRLSVKWFLSPEIIEGSIKFGASTRELAGRIAEAYEMWRQEPGAISGVAFGEAIANKP